ncbi:MAG: transposase [bacterium]
MKQWQHAPVHILDEAGTYMVTAGTYKKQHLFNTPEKIQILHDSLIEFALEAKWELQAWAIFSNHYHFIAISPDNPENLSSFISKLHMVTAKIINQVDRITGRKVWFQYWDSQITFQKSYLARLNYVHDNPVYHGLVNEAEKYPWCSALWFLKTADTAFQNTVRSFKTDHLKVIDDF